MMMGKIDMSRGYKILVNRWLTTVVNQLLTVNHFSDDLGQDNSKTGQNHIYFLEVFTM